MEYVNNQNHDEIMLCHIGNKVSQINPPTNLTAQQPQVGF